MSKKDLQFIDQALAHPWMFYVYFWKWPRIVRQACAEYALLARERDDARAAHEQAVRANKIVRDWIHVTHRLDMTADMRAIWTAGKRLSALLLFLALTLSANAQLPPILRNQWTTNANPLALKVISTNGVRVATNVWELDFTNTATVTVSAVSNANKVMVSFTGSASSGSSSLTNALLHAGPTNGSVDALVLTAGTGIDLSTIGTNRMVSVTGELTNWVNFPTNIFGNYIANLDGSGTNTSFSPGSTTNVAVKINGIPSLTTNLLEWSDGTNRVGFVGPQNIQLLENRKGDAYIGIGDTEAAKTFWGFPYNEFWFSAFSTNIQDMEGLWACQSPGTSKESSIWWWTDTVHNPMGALMQLRVANTNITSVIRLKPSISISSPTNLSSSLLEFQTLVGAGLERQNLIRLNSSVRDSNAPALFIDLVGISNAPFAQFDSYQSIGNPLSRFKISPRGTIEISGTVTNLFPLLDASQIWSNSAVAFSGIKLNVTNVASAAGSYLLQLQSSSNSLVTVDFDGDIETIRGVTGYSWPTAHAAGVWTNDGTGLTGWKPLSDFAGGGGIASIYTNNVLAGGPGLTELEFTNTATVTWAATTNAGRVTMSASASAGVQTPWASDIDAAAFSLTNFGSKLTFTNGSVVSAVLTNSLTISNSHLRFGPHARWDIGADNTNSPRSIYSAGPISSQFDGTVGGELRSYQSAGLYLSLRTDTVSGKSGIYRSSVADFILSYNIGTGNVLLDAPFSGSDVIVSAVTGGGSVQLLPQTGLVKINGTTAAFPAFKRASGHLQMVDATGANSTNSFFFGNTVNTTASTGMTMNRQTGRVRLASGSQTYLVTNNLATANSIVTATVNSDDANALSVKAIPAAGLITLKVNAATAADTDISFFISSP